MSDVHEIITRAVGFNRRQSADFVAVAILAALEDAGYAVERLAQEVPDFGATA